ncbi:MAG: PEP-CTERM sorting domain-containing protein [Luteolibacter sp.]
MKRIILIIFASALAALHSRAAVLVQWTFENSRPAASGFHDAETGGGQASGSHASAATSYTSPIGNGSGYSFASNHWEAGDFYQFTFSTLGASGITLGFDQGSSLTGPGNFEILYSTGGAFISTGKTYSVYEYTSPVTAYSFGAWSATAAKSEYSYIFDLSDLQALDNQASVTIRLQMIGASTPSGGTVATAGVSRLDNFTVSYATTVPEPGSAALFSLMALGISAKRRRLFRE